MDDQHCWSSIASNIFRRYLFKFQGGEIIIIILFPLPFQRWILVMYYVTGWLSQRFKRQKEVIFQRLEIFLFTECRSKSLSPCGFFPISSSQQNYQALACAVSQSEWECRLPSYWLPYVQCSRTSTFPQFKHFLFCNSLQVRQLLDILKLPFTKQVGHAPWRRFQINNKRLTYVHYIFS